MSSLLDPQGDRAAKLRQRREEAKFWYAYGKQRGAAEWYLRKVNSIGKDSIVLGKPKVDATDLEIGNNFTIWSGHRLTLITGWGKMRFGDRVFINSGAVIFSVRELTIGNDVAIANEAYLMDSDSHGVEGKAVKEEPISIGDGSWIGARALILPGVSIGKRCVIAAGSVVSKSVPDETLVAGNPARAIRTLEYPEGIVRAWHN